MRQAEPVQHERNGRERANQDAALVQGGLEFGQGDVRPAADEAANQSDMGLQDRTAMAAEGLTSKRLAACRMDEPASTAPRIRVRRS